MSADVELNNVSVTFGSFYAAKSVNVKINGGEFFSFLGPSGCGKTTLLRAISGFQDPSEGSVLIDNKDMFGICLLYTSPSPRDRTRSRMPSSA